MVEMFLKRIKKIHNNAKTKLEYLREKYLNQTQTMLEMFGEILGFSDRSPSYTQLGKQVQGLLDSNGGTPLLLEQYSEIASVNTKDHFPLLWSFYSPYRKALFDLVRSLEICSTSNEQSVIEAVRFVLDHQHRKSKFLKASLDLSFVSDQWRRLVVVEVDGEELLVRQQLEICIFSHLAKELKTGDACVIGSENYADFRAFAITLVGMRAKISRILFFYRHSRYSRRICFPTARATYYSGSRSRSYLLKGRPNNH